MRRIHAGVIALGLLGSAGGIYLVFASDHEETPLLTAIANLVVLWAFILTGLLAWIRRPDNRFGALMTAVGLSWFLGALSESNSSVPFTVGWVLGGVFLAVFLHALLAFPRGYLETRAVYFAVGAAYAVVVGGSLLVSFFDDFSDDCTDCPPNAFLVYESETAVTAITLALAALAIPALGAAAYVLIRRWRAASAPLRRVLGPVYATSAAALVLLVITIGVQSGSQGAGDALYWVLLFTFGLVPVAFVAGLLRTRLARAGVGQLVVELGHERAPGELRDALSRALGDPTLRLAYWLPERQAFVEIDGQPLELPQPADDPDEGPMATLVERNGRRIGALLHDPSLRDDPALLDAVAAAAALALENERRLAELAQAEARNRALLDAIPDLMFRLRADGTYLDFKGDPVDLAAPPERLVGSTLHDVLPQDVADRLLSYIHSALAQREVPPVEYQLVLAGRTRDFEARASVSGEDEVVLIVRDVTERNRLHADLQRERDFIRTVVDSAPSFFCLVDPAGRVVRLNRTLEEASGRRDDDAVRRLSFWEAFITPEDQATVRLEFERFVARGHEGEYESRWVKAGGGHLVVAWSLTPLLDERGEQRYLVAGMDVTERKRQEAELRSSRARIVEAGDVERRRLERNLHDGAQQRLVALSLGLRLAQSMLGTHPEEAERRLAAAADELGQALEELRELARGIHPAVLSDRGLNAALESLAARTPVPIDLATPDSPLPAPIEAAAYYVVSEALANVAKYADASSVEVRVERVNGKAVVEVADDGVGGADPSRGSGLRGLVDRVEALDGSLEVVSALGGGTRIRAEFPCG